MDSSRIDADFGTALRTARTRAGLSQESLAASLYLRGSTISQATIGKIERGERKVTIGEAYALAEALGVPIDELTATGSHFTKKMLAKRLYQLRKELENAIRDFEFGQQLVAQYSGSLEKDDQEGLRYETLESVEDVLEIYRMEQASDNQHFQNTGFEDEPSPLLKQYREKFGASIELKERPHAVAVIKSGQVT